MKKIELSRSIGDIDRSKLVYETEYGITTDIYMLPAGTRFYVMNQAWIGEILEENNEKYLHTFHTGEKHLINEKRNYGLVIKIIKESKNAELS